MTQPGRSRIVVVGGGQAGGRLAQLLASGSDKFAVTLVCREPHPPYERPPLSKGVLLGAAGMESCLIWPDGDPAWSKVVCRTGVSVQAIARENRTVHLSDGERLGYDHLVLATGSSARRLVCSGSDLGEIHYLRSTEDAHAIAARLAPGRRIVVVGGGFIGLEVGACARQRQLDVTLVEGSNRLLARVVPPEIASLLARRHEVEGVVLKMSTMVKRFIGNGRGAVEAVELSTGEVVPCDLAVVGIGAKPETGLAVAAGLEVDVGIRVDAALRSADPAIFACGDVATFWHRLFERHIRMESWQNAEDHARVVASALHGEATTCDAVPWFWSDQYDLSLQIAGLPHLGSSTAKRTLAGDAVILFHLGPTGRIFGATALGRPEAIGREIRLARELIAAQRHPDPIALRDPNARLKAMLGQPPAAASDAAVLQPIAG